MSATQQKLPAKKAGLSKAARGVLIALAFCLVSMVGASLIQTDFGHVTVKHIVTESASGRKLSGRLFVPDNATAETPAPAVIVVHGWWKHAESQGFNAVELSRRGFVVFAPDLYANGNSENWELLEDGLDVYDALQIVRVLPYVDSSRIGMTGHSWGGVSIDRAVEMLNEEGSDLVSSVLHIGADPTYTDADGQWYNRYGSRDVGIIASRYDDFYFNNKDENGEWRNNPRDYITTDRAKSFLSFGGDPAAFGGTPEPGKLYEAEIGGKPSSRIIYTPTQIHSWNPISPTCAKYAAEFFTRTLGAPKAIPAGNQLGMVKELFTALGLIGFGMFVVYFTILLVQKTRLFASLAADGPVLPAPAPKGAQRWWFWGGLILSGLFSYFTILPILRPFYSIYSKIWPQVQSLGVGLWGAAGGLFTLLILGLYYQFYYKKNIKVPLAETGLVISPRKLGKTILLAVIVVAASFGLVFFADYFFQTDFRFWVAVVKVFDSDKVLIALRFVPFYLIYYIVNSISINCFRFNKLGGKEWINLAVLALFNSMGIIIFELMQYVPFLLTGASRWHVNDAEKTIVSWLYVVILILAVAAVISRQIYKATKNPYLAGIINGLLVTMICCSTTVTSYGLR